MTRRSATRRPGPWPAGNDQAKAFLAEHPGRFVAMANLHYTEVWAATARTGRESHE